MRGILLVAMLVLVGCSSSETETVEITTTVQATTTVEAAAPTVATTTTAPAGNDPDDVEASSTSVT
jgi:PBP1b-binding outer membrane lipoprotein LpoB